MFQHQLNHLMQRSVLLINLAAQMLHLMVHLVSKCIKHCKVWSVSACSFLRKRPRRVSVAVAVFALRQCWEASWLAELRTLVGTTVFDA